MKVEKYNYYDMGMITSISICSMPYVLSLCFYTPTFHPFERYSSFVIQFFNKRRENYSMKLLKSLGYMLHV